MSATSLYIPIDLRMKLTLNQIEQWRYHTYNNLEKYEKFSLNRIKNMKQKIPIENDLIEVIDDELNQLLVFNFHEEKLTNKDIIFVSFDSSFISEKNIIQECKKLKQQNVNKKIFLIDTYITYIENKFKLQNLKKYSKIKKDCLETYNKLITNGKLKRNHCNNKIYYDIQQSIEKDSCIDNIFQLPFYDCNNILTELEDNFLKKNKKEWTNSMRHELNDNGFIQIISIIKNKFKNNDFYIFTYDMNMREKIKNVLNEKNQKMFVLNSM